MRLSDARGRLANVVDQARIEHEPAYLTQGGRRVAAVVDAGQLEQLIEAAEDLADIQAATAARTEIHETGEAPITWDQVKADLGIT
ncbi:MAG TPA: type II toxin-antitoxin system Phd/YefM family antitoxin [Nocardioides sp.]|uniref:type II toxin-antitoxin system Phd/YefM family antitoxin n=1 Tax=uncultured Nocardioides sp. TaxID=198441 RepID=UPI00262C4235|nr:type II toxin-antitoxin system Phd/YefM family antitoxin [uncultured Nocardioides sp.]HRD61937.1 type II toxin-antitoxin system Phd/YefM family antitoxin [Nocardioides sp.]HRI96197.1 type II toxin-antitoxin system Phd/YefM family antitoxin [Nocardioides sp.]HRK45482.1 type II toxin-antitoxin system Phd/YefM family antitoxin [Nocardioides sp.]